MKNKIMSYLLVKLCYYFILRGKYGNENVVMSDVVKAPNDIVDSGKYLAYLCG